MGEAVRRSVVGGVVGRSAMGEAARRSAAVALAVAGLLAALAGCGGSGGSGRSDGPGDEDTERQAEVAERGADVMPFDLQATTHRFTPVDSGLVQTVTADDAGDAEQVALVRDHLAHEAERFRAGDYGDPAAIHGDDMPGLAELEAGAAAIVIAYEPIGAGGRISYTTDDPALVDALHRWAEAQVVDHGSHAERATGQPGPAPSRATTSPLGRTSPKMRKNVASDASCRPWALPIRASHTIVTR